MGNQNSNKRKASNDVIYDVTLANNTSNHHDQKRRKKKKSKSRWNSKPTYTPDGSMTQESKVIVTSPLPVEDKELKVKIYQSYSNGFGRRSGRDDDIKLYPRSSEGHGQGHRKSHTAPNIRNLALRDYPELGRRTLPPVDLPSNSVRSSERASNTSSSVGNSSAIVEVKDFPSSFVVKDRLRQFEHSFIRSVVEKFSRFSCKTQLSSLSVAIRPFSSNQTISLFTYLKSQTIPTDLRPAASIGKKEPPDYILTIPTALFLTILRIRLDRTFEQEVMTTAARDIVTCIVGEMAAEVGRLFEYQIALIKESASLERLADHAADCVIDYTVRRSSRLLDRNTVVQGVIRGNPKTKIKTQFVSVIVGSQEAKWDLSKIFKKPGIRKDTLLVARAADIQDLEAPGWTFHSPKHTDPRVYGYRGLLLEWDFQSANYRIDREDEAELGNEAVPRSDDYHRMYSPCQCLVGPGLLAQCRGGDVSGEDVEALTKYAVRIRESGSIGHEIQLIYRPMAYPDDGREGSGWNRKKIQNSCYGPPMPSEFSEICDSDRNYDQVRKCEVQSEDVVRSGRLPSCQTVDTVDAIGTEDTPPLTISTIGVKSRGEILHIDDDVDDDDVAISSEEKDPGWNISGLSSAPDEQDHVIWNQSKVLERISEEESKTTAMEQDPESKTIPAKLCRTADNYETMGLRMNQFEKYEDLENCRQNPVNNQKISVTRVPLFRLSNCLPEDQRKAGSYLPGKTEKDAIKARNVENIDADCTAVKVIPRESSGQKNTFNAELKEGLRSKILQALEVLKVKEIRSHLPEARLYGRKIQVSHLTEMLTPPGSMVTITGCYGIGKSAVAIEIGHNIKAKSITAVYVDCRGCCVFESLLRSIVGHFGLRFRSGELDWFYNWLNCHDQQLLLVLDNVDLPEDCNEALSYFTDDLLRSVHKLRIVCTRNHPFYQGREASGRRTYRLGDIRESSDSLFLQIAPDLRDKDIEMLSSLCCHVPFAIRLIGSVLAFEDVDASSIVQALTLNCGAQSVIPSVETEIRELSRDECERKQLRHIVAGIVAVLANVGEVYTEVLCKMSLYAGGFDLEEVIAAVQGDHVRQAVQNLCRLGLLVVSQTKNRFHLPPAVKLVCQNLVRKDSCHAITFYHTRMLEKLRDACCAYSSANHALATEFIQTDLDNIADVLASSAESESVYEASWSLASLEGAVFLTEFLPEHIYCCFFEMLERSSERNREPQRQCQALCCLAYHHIAQGRIERAAFAASKAFHLSAALSDLDRAFCLYCLAKVYWHDEIDGQNDSLAVAKQVVDLYQGAVGLCDIRTIYACELCGGMLTAAGHLQTARHVFNIADEGVAELGLAGHPQLLHGYGCRRAIWDQVGLFERAKQMARAAARVTEALFGEHPETATALMQLCEGTIKRGSLSDALCVCIRALAMRIKVLGESHETGLSYKTLSYLMLRQTQYEGASAFGQRALEILRRSGSDRTLIDDLNDVISQARLKMAAASTGQNRETVESETKEQGTRKNVTFQELVRMTESSSMSRRALTEV